MFFQSWVWHRESLPSAWESFILNTLEMQRQMMRNALVSVGWPPHMFGTNPQLHHHHTDMQQ